MYATGIPKRRVHEEYPQELSHSADERKARHRDTPNERKRLRLAIPILECAARNDGCF